MLFQMMSTSGQLVLVPEHLIELHVAAGYTFFVSPGK